MEIKILNARMAKDADGYSGTVEFEVEGHKLPYEMTLFSEKGKEWEYGLHFLNESGTEEDISKVEEYLEESDDAFYRLIQAAEAALKE